MKHIRQTKISAKTKSIRVYQMTEQRSVFNLRATARPMLRSS